MVTMKSRWTQRRRNCWTIKLVVACCIVLFIFSPAFSRKLPADSKTHLERQVLLERRRELRERILGEAEGEPGDLTNDYSTPTHNHNGQEETPSPPASKGTVRGTKRYGETRVPAKFDRYTAYGHRHLRGV